MWGYRRRLPWGIHFDASEVETAGPKCLHLGQAIIQIIHLLSFLSSPLHWEQKLFPLVSHKWHRPAQLIIIQPLWPSWLIGMRVYWSICLRISSEAAAAPPPLSEPADSSCGINTAVCTLRMDAEVKFRGICSRLYRGGGLSQRSKNSACWREGTEDNAHLSQWLQTFGSSGFRLHMLGVKLRSRHRAGRATGDPIFLFFHSENNRRRKVICALTVMRVRLRAARMMSAAFNTPEVFHTQGYQCTYVDMLVWRKNKKYCKNKLSDNSDNKENVVFFLAPCKNIISNWTVSCTVCLQIKLFIFACHLFLGPGHTGN